MFKASLEQIKDLLDARVISCPDRLETVIDTVLASDLMSDILVHPKPGGLLITGLSNTQIVHTVLIADMAAAIIVRGRMPEDRVIATAQENGIPILSTRSSLFETCGRLYAMGLRGVPPEEHFVHVIKTPV